MKNYYEILEVDSKASDEIIAKVYKMHIKKNHPDLYQGEEKLAAEEKLKVLNEVYETLSDKTKKTKYDEELENKKITEEVCLQQEIEFLKFELSRKDQIIEILNEKFNLNLGKSVLSEKNYEDDYEMLDPIVQDSDTNYDSNYNQDTPKTKLDIFIYNIKMLGKKVSYVLMAIILFYILILNLTGINLLDYIIDK